MTSEEIKRHQDKPFFIQTNNKSWLSEIAYQLACLNEREDRKSEGSYSALGKKIVK